MSKEKGRLNRSVSIIGVGLSPMGSVLRDPEIKFNTEGELIAAAVIDALQDAGVTARDIDAFYLGQLGPGIWSNMAGGAGRLAHWLGMKGKPGLSHDECCTTSNIGLHQAALAVASGMYDMVLTGAVNIYTAKPTTMEPTWKYTPKDPMEAGNEVNYMVMDSNYQSPGRGLLNGLNDWARLYARKYGLSRQQLNDVMNEVSRTCRWNAVHHPNSLPITETYEEEAKRYGFDNVQEYLSNDQFNPYLNDIMRLKHNAHFFDGATAQIVCSTELAKKICDHPVEIAGISSISGWDTDFDSIPMELDANMAKKAYDMAGIIDPYNEIDYLSVHDCSAQNWMVFGENVGYFKPGEGWQAILDGRCGHLGDKPINTSGGRIGFGHPSAGANGIEIAEAVYQMRGQAGDRQMPTPPKTALIHSIGGSYHFSATVLRAL